jgi:hypothetical protein
MMMGRKMFIIVKEYCIILSISFLSALFGALTNERAYNTFVGWSKYMLRHLSHKVMNFLG